MNILLETERLILREFEKEDAKHIFRLHNDPDVMKYIPHKEPLDVPMEKCELFVNHFMDLYKTEPGYGLYALILKETGDYIGWNEFHQLDDTDEIEIGYRYFKEFWGNGYATESSKALVDYGFNTMGEKKLVGVAMPDNTASCRVLEKIGMKFKEMRRYYGVDLAYYEIFCE